MSRVKLCQPRAARRPSSQACVLTWLWLALPLAACGADDAESDASSAGGGGASGSTISAGGASGASTAGAGGATSTGRAGSSAAGRSGADAGSSGAGRGSSGAGGGGGGSGMTMSCDRLPGTCIELCQGGSCSCHCECRIDRECGGVSLCVPPGEPAPPCCGIGAQCFDHEDCGATSPGSVCSGGPCARCLPPCPDDAFCGDGHVCNPEGLCERARCDRDGFTCPARSTCDAGHPESDSHGCLHDACADDAECQRGVCVSGRCYDTGGRCVPSLCP